MIVETMLARCDQDFNAMLKGFHTNSAIIIKYLSDIPYELVPLWNVGFSPFVLENVSFDFGHCQIYYFVFFRLFIKGLDAFLWRVDHRITVNKNILPMSLTLSSKVLLRLPHAKDNTGNPNN